MVTLFGYLALAAIAAFLIVKFIFKRDEGFYFLVLWAIFATLNRALNHEWVLAAISATLLAVAAVATRDALRKSSK